MSSPVEKEVKEVSPGNRKPGGQQRVKKRNMVICGSNVQANRDVGDPRSLSADGHDQWYPLATESQSSRRFQESKVQLPVPCLECGQVGHGIFTCPRFWNNAEESGKAAVSSCGHTEEVAGMDAAERQRTQVKGMMSATENGKTVSVCGTEPSDMGVCPAGRSAVQMDIDLLQCATRSSGEALGEDQLTARLIKYWSCLPFFLQSIIAYTSNSFSPLILSGGGDGLFLPEKGLGITGFSRDA